MTGAPSSHKAAEILWGTSGGTLSSLAASGSFGVYNSITVASLLRTASVALIAARQSLDLVERSGTTETIFLNWMNIGQDLVSLGQVDQALDAFHRARDRMTDPLSRNAANLWRDIVQAELARHNLAAALQEVTRFQANAVPTPSYFRSQSIFAHADLLIATDEYSAVPAVVRAALTGIPDAADRALLSYEAVNELMSCVLASMNTLSYQEAIALAGEMDRSIEGLPFPISVFTHNAVRMRRRLAGDLGGVLRDDSAALESARKASNVPLVIETLHSLAADYAAANSVGNQIAALEEALLLERALQPPDLAAASYASAHSFLNTLVSLGNAYARNKEAGKARRCFAESVKTVDAQTIAATKAKLARLRAQAVLGLAESASLDDDADTARSILEETLADTGHSYDRADVLLRLARLDREDRPEAAPAHHQEALSAMRVARNRNTEIATRLELAKVLVGKGSIKAAAEQLQVASSSAAMVNFADADWKCAMLSGVIAESQSNLKGAVAAYQDSVRKVEASRSRLGGAEQRQAFIDNESVNELYGRLISTLTRLDRHEEAWQYVERAKARVFVESLQGRRFRESVPESAKAGIALLEKQLVSVRMELAPENESVRGSGRGPAVLEAERRQLEARFTLAREQAGLNASRPSQAVSLTPASLSKVRAMLPKATVLVEFSLLPDSLTAFIITRTFSRQILWKVDKGLRAKVIRLQTMLADSNSAEKLKPLLADVSEAVWTPVAGALPADVNSLLIVPAAYLNYLPFQVLLEPSGTSLIDRFSISYLPSATTLTLLRETPKHKKDLFLGALGTVSVEGWAPLPGTLRETSGIAKIYPEAQRANERELTHDAALAALRDHERVHFATHGLLDEHAPLFSALLVSPAPGQSTRLSLYELMDLKLKAKLVVLSACETGVGKLLGGDEVTGLTRTILSAGASTVVSSLWKVSDDSTAMLMQGFYSRLHAGVRPAQALRTSALEVRSHFAHPFYWSPFVVTGAY